MYGSSMRRLGRGAIDGNLGGFKGTLRFKCVPWPYSYKLKCTGIDCCREGATVRSNCVVVDFILNFSNTSACESVAFRAIRVVGDINRFSFSI